MISQAPEQAIAVFLPTWVGDVTMATPALRTLRTALPQHKLVGVVRGVGDQLLDGTQWLDEFVHYDRNWLGSGSVHQAIARLRQIGCSTAILLSNSFTTAAMSWLAGCHRRIGFVRYGRRMLLTDALHAPRTKAGFTPRSATVHYNEALEPLGLTVADQRLELTVTAEEENLAESFWRKNGLSDSQPVVVLNTGGAYGAAKRWPDEHFVELARKIACQLSVSVVINCGPAEQKTAAEIAATADHPRVISLAGEALSIGFSKAVIARAALVVTGDTGPRHIAAAFQRPTVALFGSTDPRWSSNGNPHETALQLQLDCQPCAKRTCPLQHHRCMRELTVEQVFQIARTSLATICVH